MTASSQTAPPPTTNDGGVDVNDLTIRHADGFHVTDFIANGNDLDRGGEDDGRLTVRINVDGQRDQVLVELGQTGTIAGLDRAVNVMTQVRDELVALLGDRAWKGRCLTHGDWGRCLSPLSHVGEHEFPTESSRRAFQSYLASVEEASA